ncbi:uncharacterized protein LOC132637458 [Lycium barbarum]|uniref:uncharacterized protein LOC132637458 n=1 Tax=Lycium barbarum TaxID=112863 RepID=UPI00293F629F|nr:uncharacterized protein LOC132637458 [Lycium barbarum]
MRTFKWDPWFDPEEETKIAIAWISFPSLPPNYFVKEAVFSLASAVGKPLQVDMATANKTRLSWHNEQDCYVIHPELYPKDEEQSSDKEQEENSKEDQRKNKDQKNAKNSRSESKDYKGPNANIMKGKESEDKVQHAEVNDNDGFKEKKGKQRNNRHFHRGKYDENSWRPKENQTLQNNQYVALQNTDEDIKDLTDMKKSSDGRMVEAKVSDASNQIVTVQQIVDTNDRVKEKQMEESKEKQMDESNQVERISAKAWIEKNFGKQLNDKREILSQQVSKVNSSTTVRQEKEHDLEETGDTLIHKNLEEEDKSGEVLQEDPDQDETPISDEEVEDNEGKEGK